MTVGTVLLLATNHIHADNYYGNPLSTNNVAYRPAIEIPQSRVLPVQRLPVLSTGHSTRASKTISEEALRQRLQQIGSPLAPYAGLLAQSPNYGTILGICSAEQYLCTKAHDWNFWGIKGVGQCGSYKSFADYCTAEEGINAIDSFLDKAYNNGRTTIESLLGWYCQSACTNWYPTVIKYKAIYEN